MPTGYTSDIKDGISFEKFVMSCARAFGACVEMRDEPMDKEIPEEFKPSDYHKDKLVEAESELVKVQALSDEEAAKAAGERYAKELLDIKTGMEAARSLKKKYEDMLVQVQTWTPPTKDHVELKKFMAKQITESIDFDCGTRYLENKNPVCLTAKEWRAFQIERIHEDIVYHTKHDLEERERARKRTEWVRDLRKSLRKENHVSA